MQEESLAPGERGPRSIWRLSSGDSRRSLRIQFLDQEGIIQDIIHAEL